MSDVLSQTEIDSLLSALSSGDMDVEELKKEEQEKKIRDYDFKRALRFSKDQIRGLTRIYENYSRLLTTHFSAQLRTFVDISVSSVDQLPYEEFIRSIPEMTILNIFQAHPLEGRMVMEMNPHIAYSMLDRMLGGRGADPSQVSTLTEIETTVMERILRRAIDQLPEAFRTLIDIQPEMETLEMNPQFMQIVSPNETVAVVTLNTKIGDVSGMINFALPHLVLEPVIPKLSAHHWFSSRKKRERKPHEVQELENKVRKTQVPFVAKLGHSQIHIREFLQLTKGDVIRLQQSIDDPLCIQVGQRTKFLGQPGIHRGKQAVQITKVLSEEDEHGSG